ncbi:MAG TPA: hypothetical protein VJG32_15020 [Anaerolineae bacterium]|nr:hypothetical protein [Anaerolineae bacterium]
MDFTRLIVFILGIAVVSATILSAIHTFVLPRSANVLITRIVFRTVRRVFELRLRRAQTYADRDRIMALYAPFGLLALPFAWLVLVLIGYMGMFRALGIGSWYEAFRTSGSSLLTLGFAAVDGLWLTMLAFSEAAIGLVLVALLIAYLPTMYAAFQRRETEVTKLEVRAGSPPSALEMIARFHRLHGFDGLGPLWATWETWFTDVEESHTSLAALVFFRSPQPEHSWVTAAGTVLDTAAMINSAIDTPRDIRADLCIRAGYLALRHIADFFRVPYNADPKPDDPISLSREEFEAACDDLAGRGIPLKPDRDRAWRDFAGWRVNYDTVLLALAALTMAPYAPWSSDRSILPVRRARARSVISE